MYIGRFAPSPTGPLHFGSLIAAVASYCEAKAHQGKWLVRMEDLDKPREVKGAADNILHTLEAFGMEWDDKVVYQSQRNYLYAEAFDKLLKRQIIYPCTCTRKEVADLSITFGIDGAIYPKTCLHHPLKPNAASAWRIKTNNSEINFSDAIQGELKQILSEEVGDFILKRADGLFAYQLAVVVDDAIQGVTHIVRGADLLDSTPRQIFIQQQLDLTTPWYAHVPVATNLGGEKLSKQTLAPALDQSKASLQLWQAFSFLNQNPPIELQSASLRTLWTWVRLHWSRDKIPRQRNIVI